MGGETIRRLYEKHIKLGMLLTITCAIVLGGCSSPNPYGDAYGSSDTRKVQQVYYGTIEKVEPVTIDASTQSNAIGTIAGAAVGGILGSKIGAVLDRISQPLVVVY